MVHLHLIEGDTDMLMDTDKFVLQALDSGALVDDVNSNRSAMLRAAINAAKNAYCPYSKFHVGAALLTFTANIYAGCNVENVMYSSMSHAEQTAITAAITAEGPDMLIMEMVIWTPSHEPTPPCGACRQLIREHVVSEDVWVYSFCQDPTKQPLGLTIDELLPHSFGPKNL